jgi:hypothetical protein
LFEQNNEKTTRLSIRLTVTGTAKVMAYDDITEAQRKRDMKEAIMTCIKGRRRKCQNCEADEDNRPCAEELEAGRCEIGALGLENYRLSARGAS